MLTDIQSLLRSVGAEDLPYQELQTDEERQAAAERWPLLNATIMVLVASDRQLTPAHPPRAGGKRS